jgi:hypothetical protein
MCAMMAPSSKREATFSNASTLMHPIANRIFLGASVALLISCDAYRFGSRNHTTVLKAGFEAAEGYLADRPLVGQQGWTYGGWGKRFGSAAQGIRRLPFPGSPQHAFIGGVPGTTQAGVYVGLAHFLPAPPTAGFDDVVEFSCQQLITDSTNGGRNYFEWVFYDRQGRLLCGLLFDNKTLDILQRNSDNSAQTSGLKFARGEVYKIKVKFDLKENVWTAAIGGKRTPPRSITSYGRQRALGSFSPVWWSNSSQAPFPGGPVAGNNVMSFDDVTVDFYPSRK